MPIYEYRCQDCGHELEALQKIQAPPLIDCPACGHPALQKQVSAAAFRLKGSGWYETDFKKGGKKNLHDSKPPAAAKPAEGQKTPEAGKSEAKPAAKPAATKPTPG